MNTIGSMEYLNTVHRQLNPELQPFTRYVLQMPNFFQWPASRSTHHNHQGGLVIHTADVVQRLIAMSPSMVNMDILIVAAFFHDCCKVYEYDMAIDPNDERQHIIVDMPYRNEIGHIVGGAMLFSQIAVDHGTDYRFRDAVTHCLLSHHGRKEWGSPVEPATQEAWLLHSVDMMSSREQS